MGMGMGMGGNCRCNAERVRAHPTVFSLPRNPASRRILSISCGSRLRAAALTALLLGASAGCSSLDFWVANAPSSFGSFSRSRDMAYGENPRQRLDVFSPKNAHGRPVVVFFYGGSWTMGRKSQYAFVAAALAERGYVTVIPDYRLYPEVRFPVFVEDGARAVAWVELHAREFGGDPDRIVLMGHSAGAHTAALLALDDAYLERAGASRRSIVGLIGLSGPYALVPDTDTLHAIFTDPYTADDWQPVRFASSNSPPTLLLHGMADRVVYVAHTEKLRDALSSHGAQVETHLYPNRGHADTIASFTVVARWRTPALEQTIEFLKRITGS